MYSTPFLRLSSKTQVFRTGNNDHLRTRLTHTLEVSQIARTIAQELGLDLDLTEAIALGHDIGHTPFGHIGERTLNEISQNEIMSTKIETFKVNDSPLKAYNGFKHNQQSVRVLVDFAKGISLTNYCLYGIRAHSDLCWKNDPSTMLYYNKYDKFCSLALPSDNINPSWSFEAFVVYWADEIAQRHHDIEDAYRCNLISKEGLLSLSKILLQYYQGKPNRFQKKIDVLEATMSKEEEFERKLSSFVVDFYVTVLINELRSEIIDYAACNKIERRRDFINKYPILDHNTLVDTFLKLSNKRLFTGTDKNFKEELKGIIIPSYAVQRQDGKGGFIVRKLINAYITNPQQLPDTYIEHIFTNELIQSLSVDHLKQIRLLIDKSNLPQDISSWTPFHSRKALNILCDSPEGYPLIYPLIFRSIFDYISGMTDIYAQEEYKLLYS